MLEVKYHKSWKQNTAKVCNEMPQIFATATEYLLFFYAPYSANNIDDYWHFKTKTATNLAATVFHTSFC